MDSRMFDFPSYPKRICIVIVTFHRPDLLKRCIISVVEAISNSPYPEITIRVLINGHDLKSWQTAHSLKQSLTLPQLSIEMQSESITPASARNKIIAKERTEEDGSFGADWFYFLDDDAYIPKHLFTNFIESLQQFPKAAVVGGPNLTPSESSLFQKATGIVLASFLGSLISRARYRPYGKIRSCDESELILCNLFVHSESLKFEGFKEDLLCSEENWLLQSLMLQGKQLLYNPELFVWHERRPNLIQFASQIYFYAYGRGQTIRQRPSSARYYHFLPSFGLFSLCMILISGDFKWVGALYFGFCVGVVIYTNLTYAKFINQFRILIMMPFLFPIIHFSYGVGLLSGLSKTSKRAGVR